MPNVTAWESLSVMLSTYIYIVLAPWSCCRTMIVLSHNDRGVRLLIIGGPLYCKHTNYQVSMLITRQIFTLDHRNPPPPSHKLWSVPKYLNRCTPFLDVLSCELLCCFNWTVKPSTAKSLLQMTVIPPCITSMLAVVSKEYKSREIQLPKEAPVPCYLHWNLRFILSLSNWLKREENTCHIHISRW